ncbi:MAG TPA: LuxR C-terminal-related transcriptional regulator, partial [Symbiobacteriaceae bacterium]|nr:LuxR C-terminal-related transcriptional regulator [Symbiobacteriaceae bacterium]
GDAVLGHPFTLVSAPAGYGKTTLLASLARVIPAYPLAWVTLEPEENDPVRFLSVVAAALQRLSPDAGGAVLGALSAPPPASAAELEAHLRTCTATLLNEILHGLPGPFILVLDDLHMLTCPATYQILAFIVEHMPPQMRLVVGSRYDPPLRLARLAARRQLAELRRGDLRFSPQEASQFLNGTLGLNLAADEIAPLQEWTEGWAVGLCLLGGALGRLGAGAGRASFLADLVHSERSLFDFLAEEMLNAQPDGVRRFLLQTSVLTELTPVACRAVTGQADAGALLEQLYKQNLVIAISQSGGATYRYHALFAEFLRAQLDRELPGAATELHRLAAEAQTAPGRAVEHYLAAGLWDAAADAILQAGMEMLGRGMYETVRRWFGALPAEVRSARPRLVQLMARAEIHRGEYAAAVPFLQLARAAFQEAGDPAAEAEILSSLITVTMQQNDFPRAAELAQSALGLPLNPQIEATAHLTLVWLYLAQGRWAEVRTEVATALAGATRGESHPGGLAAAAFFTPLLAAVPGCLELAEVFCTAASAYAQPESPLHLGVEQLRATLLLWRGDLAGARTVALAAEALRQRLGGYTVLGLDLAAVLATVHTALGEEAAAAQAVERILQRLGGAPPVQWPLGLYTAGRTLCALGRLEQAREMHARLSTPFSGTELPVTPVLRDRLAGLIALAGHHLDEAEARLTRAAEAEAVVPAAAAGGSARLLLARLRLERGDAEGAVALFQPLFAQWLAEGIPGLVFLDGPWAVPLLRLAAARGMAVAGQFLVTMGQPVAESSPAAALAEPLTQREQDVLRLLVTGLTNREIARQLFVSDETVKSHVVRIFRKLDVTTRTQAAMRARELGL